ncbi:hypothetical protein BLA24_03010 [Streptomyces cinnamoneus]|uniref:Cellulose synthase n=1 Tax=Streptomyces cinnamoneus TaxID=53446 RepID=A0A2G1XPX2_STRCJ|nr:hypothetical protein [Streptomyces cinnamoneus]PHQ53295.1 hypothetical protein BLA24_03010 [Streptomyces cinnamoneus]PPT12392.1 hypothetical protein CYQ11_05310 [Streptomyces cinnamoneus]
MLISTVCAAVSAAGLGIALLTAYRKRFLAATRIAAYALVPIGLVLTGVIDWVTDLVFKPSVWAGFGILALSAALFMISRAVERRRGGTRKERRRAAAAGRPEALAPTASAPSLGSPRQAERPKAGKAKPPQGDGEDFSDIEAILKKHGI